ncbi:MAG TPA: MFS transporter [Ktedonobacterales bacterium]
MRAWASAGVERASTGHDARASTGRPYYGWVLVVALGVTTIISYGTTQYLFGVLVVPISNELGWSRASVSGAFSVGVIVGGLTGVPVGRLVDRYGARVLMAVGSALGGASLLGLSGVHALWQFYALWSGGIGIATALTFYPVTFTVVANWFQRRRGAALAILTLLGGLSSPIYIPLAGLLVAKLDWRGALVVLALTQLCIALPLHALLLRRHPEDLGLLPDGDTVAPAPAVLATASDDSALATDAAMDTAPISTQPAVLTGVALRAGIRQVAFWSLTVAFALALLANSVLFVHQIAYLIGRHYGAVFAADVAGAVGLASLPGRFVLNWLSDRLRPERLLASCLVAQAAGVVLLVYASSPIALAGYVVVYGAAFGAISPLRATVMAEHFGRRAFGAITAVQGVPVALAAGLGPLAAGWLYDRLGSYGLVLWLCAAAFALAGVAVALTPRPHSPADLVPGDA